MFQNVISISRDGNVGWPSLIYFVISIIIPTYNRVESLKKCIQSLLLQYYIGLEIIIIDDDSDDRTNEYLETLRQYEYISLIFNRNNHGVNYSRNRGIEVAKNDFILFLDSDDFLLENTLGRIRSIIEAHKRTTHFLFLTTDRIDSFKKLTKIQDVLYEDWLSGQIFGDFTHVVATKIMRKYLFFEQFRRYEHLNWFRIFKETSPQLLVPLVTTQRDRNRSDSLTFTGKLRNISAIQSQFESQKLYYSLYHADLRRYSPVSLTYKLIATLMLGVACGQKRECRSIMCYASKPHIKVLGSFVMLLPASWLKYGIIKYSFIKGVKISS